MHIPTNEDIRTAFIEGHGIEFELPKADTTAMHNELAKVGEHLSTLPTEKSFAWTTLRPTRQSYWIASKAGSQEFVASDKALEEFDGDKLAGDRGLLALKEDSLVEPLNSLKQRADLALQAAALAIGIPQDYVEKCTTRYRLIRYTGQGAGIGTHFDGNGLTTVLTDQPGLCEIGYDGKLREIDPRSVSVMSGSSVYRASRGSERPLLPAFHLVRALGKDGVKHSMAAFWNLPDKTTIPAILGTGFYHDIGTMKNDDGPKGSLGNLWECVAGAHGISVADLSAGRFK